MKLLVNVCARGIYAVYGAAALGLYLALIFGGIGGLIGIASSSAVIAKNFTLIGLDIGLVLGALIGGLGKTSILNVAREIWCGLPHALFTMVMTVIIFGVPMMMTGWALGALFGGQYAFAFGIGLGSSGAVFGALIGFATGYSQREYALDAIFDAIKTFFPVILLLGGIMAFMVVFMKLVLMLVVSAI